MGCSKKRVPSRRRKEIRARHCCAGDRTIHQFAHAGSGSFDTLTRSERQLFWNGPCAAICTGFRTASPTCGLRRRSTQIVMPIVTRPPKIAPKSASRKCVPMKLGSPRPANIRSRLVKLVQWMPALAASNAERPGAQLTMPGNRLRPSAEPADVLDPALAVGTAPGTEKSSRRCLSPRGFRASLMPAP
jgi:hypothetical protein